MKKTKKNKYDKCKTAAVMAFTPLSFPQIFLSYFPPLSNAFSQLHFQFLPPKLCLGVRDQGWILSKWLRDYLCEFLLNKVSDIFPQIGYLTYKPPPLYFKEK